MFCCSIGKEAYPKIKRNTYISIQSVHTFTLNPPSFWYRSAALFRCNSHLHITSTISGISHGVDLPLIVSRVLLSLPLSMSICNQDLPCYICIYESLLKHSLPLKPADCLFHRSSTVSPQITRKIKKKRLPFFFMHSRSVAFQFCLPSNCPSLNLIPCFSCRRL
jgi:hypothetical protein